MTRRAWMVVAAVAAVLVPATAYATHSFADVEDGRFFTEPVEWAVANDITTGKSPTSFDPSGNVTRGETVTFLKRYHDNIAANLDTDTNTDTLGDLGCATGQIPKWTGSAWACSQDTDTNTDTDTLGDLNCGANQVAINDGGWRCASPVLQRGSYDGFTNHTLETNGFVGLYTSIAIGTNGNPTISHHDATNGDLEVYVCADPDCTTGTNHTLETTGNVGAYTSIAIGANHNPIISHHDDTNGDLEVYVCADPDCTSGTNHTLETTGDVGLFTSIAIGADNNPIISHHDVTNGDLEVYVCANPDCSSGGTNHTLETTGYVGRYTSIAIGANGNPIISHRDDTNVDLEVYVCANPDCSAGTNRTLETTGWAGVYTSIAIGADNNPIISHRDDTNNDLEVYVCANPDCSSGGTNHTLETTGDVGRYTSIAIGANGNPIISHYDWTNGDLEVYVCANPDCTSRGTNHTLETTGNVGWNTSIAIGTNGNPIISHYDFTNGDLEVAVVRQAVTGITFE